MSRATREAYGQTLVELVNEGHDIVAVDADLAGSTKLADLQKAFPQRMVDVGIAEQNMVGVASGLALTGRTVFTGSFAVFATGRAYDQIRNTVCDSGLNVKICPTHAGITVGEDGATHQCNEDIAVMRTIPGMTVIIPSDAVEAEAAVKAAYDHNGPVYMRFGRLPVPVFNTNPDYHFELGKGIVLKEGTDVTLVACGLMVPVALEVAEQLAAEGVNAEVINIHTIKPLDTELITTSAAKTGKVVTIEEHSVIGGLGSAVCQALAENAPVPVKVIGVQDTYGESGPALQVLAKYGLDTPSVLASVKDFLK